MPLRFYEASVPLVDGLDDPRTGHTFWSWYVVIVQSKHIAAVYYLLGEQFDTDPFLLFHLRGRTREQVMDALQHQRCATDDAVPEMPTIPEEPVAALTEVLPTFYDAGDDLDHITVHLVAPAQHAMLLQRGSAPPAQTEHALRTAYQMMTTHTLRRVLGEDDEA